MKKYSYGICPYIIRENKVFILLNQTSYKSTWNFFKGKIEEGETIHQAAQREFAEEVGLKVPNRMF